MNKDFIRIIKEKCYSSNNILNPHTYKKDWWIKNDILHIFEDIMNYTSFLEVYDNISMKQRLYHYLNSINYLIKCKNTNCDNIVSWNQKYQEYCSKKCIAIGTLEKRKKTSIEKYGTDNPSKSETIKEKIKKTNIEKYGVENYSITDDFKIKIGKYWEENKKNILKYREIMNYQNFGFSYPFQNPKILEKTRKTMIKKYGTEYPLQVPEFLEKLKKTNIDRHGVEIFLQKNISPIFLENRDNKDWFIDLLNKKSIREIAQEFTVSYSLICQTVNKLGIDISKYSSGHIEIFNFLKTYTENIVLNDRTILNGKEIDLFLPDHKLAIEYNGVYWHSETKGKDKKYHINKTTKCFDKDIKLIHVFENDWIKKSNIIKSIILSNINKINNIYARKCKVVEVSKEQEKYFLEKNHLQGYIPSNYCIGLYYNHSLVQIMSFGNPRFNKKYQYELLRTATLLNYRVVGGASKLIKYFIKKINPSSIISYSDIRYFSGIIYKNMGFTYVNKTEPNYYYVDQYGILHNRMKFQKHKLSKKLGVFDNSLSEYQNMINNGYNRIWDCGNSVWEWKKS